MQKSLVIASLLALTAFAPVAEAKSRLMWEGGFFGGRWVEEVPFFAERQLGSATDGAVKRTIYHREHRIFASNRACEAWLYKMRSTWQDMPRYSWCKRVRVSS